MISVYEITIIFLRFCSSFFMILSGHTQTHYVNKNEFYHKLRWFALNINNCSKDKLFLFCRGVEIENSVNDKP